MVILGQPANSYTHYITTQEEYRYEGASTFYVNATLVGANLRNDLQLERTYAAVERLNGKNEGELPSEDE
ncbi:hypothetical protein BJF96_g7090 [Verticillium dahliae]|uniref:Neutral/alkaline non-lysosomal ceramidase N-terminal domain-containing protein n=1 Tax=Verticillium dahliae TaxID=27337 RepID=A0AA44WDL6_VERDA|nr:hypothetical protein BJF96_g7090 [Verticillium dahliae]PNH56899.1 hypothetical protein VD0003_g862 [Verticillium dahliae]